MNIHMQAQLTAIAGSTSYQLRLNLKQGPRKWTRTLTVNLSFIDGVMNVEFVMDGKTTMVKVPSETENNGPCAALAAWISENVSVLHQQSEARGQYSIECGFQITVPDTEKYRTLRQIAA